MSLRDKDRIMAALQQNPKFPGMIEAAKTAKDAKSGLLNAYEVSGGNGSS